MRIWGILLGLAAVPACAACGGPDRTLTDWPLHRQWLIGRDCRYPGHPAHLIEIPWRDPIAPHTDLPVTVPHVPLVRPGMKVMVEQQSDHAQVRLIGVALESGSAGQRILVRAGLGGAALHCIVRGPGLAVLDRGKGGK